ncbi:hypothetical protein ALON55S_08761 [Alishewanella longhuensis]
MKAALVRQLGQLSEAGYYSDPLTRIIDTTEAFEFEQAQHLIASLLTELEP